MLIKAYLYVCYLTFLIGYSEAKGASRRDVRAQVLPPCKENDRNPYQFSGSLVKRDAQIYAFNGTFNAKRDLRMPADVSSVHRLRSARSVNAFPDVFAGDSVQPRYAALWDHGWNDDGFMQNLHERWWCGEDIYETCYPAAEMPVQSGKNQVSELEFDEN